MSAFEDFGVMPEIIKAVEEMDWLLPTPVQAEAIPLALGGGDLLVAAETGSGKTGAFCLPILQITHEAIKEMEASSSKQKEVAADVDSMKMVLSTVDRDAELAVDPTGLICQARNAKDWQGGRTTRGIGSKGKWYFEATVRDEGLCRVGFSTAGATLQLGTDRRGFGYGGTAKKSLGNKFDNYGTPYKLGDTVGCFLDREENTISFSKNGQWYDVAFYIPKDLATVPLYPAVCLKNAELELNFGEKKFRFPPGYGFRPCIEAPVPSAEIQLNNNSTSRSEKRKPTVLIFEPNRDLAEQTYQEILKFTKYLPTPRLQIALFIGGVPTKQQTTVCQNDLDIVVGTPGRITELVGNGDLSLRDIRFLVLDEADQLVKQGMAEIILDVHKKIPKETPNKRRLQVMMFSATLHEENVKSLANKITQFPTWVDLKGPGGTIPETVHHVVYRVDPTDSKLAYNYDNAKIATDGIHSKDSNVNVTSTTVEALSEKAKLAKGPLIVKLINAFKMDQAMIFCRTKLDCDNLERYLHQTLGGKSYPGDKKDLCVVLHSDRSQQERRENLFLFKKGQSQFLICTDVAARGIDVQGLPYVINVTLPDNVADYIHRIGRVGRADRMGLAISLISTVQEKVWYHSCPSRGSNCHNTRLKDEGGCAIWYDEPQLLNDIQQFLDSPIDELTSDFTVPGGLVQSEDGSIIYGAKRQSKGKDDGFKSHNIELQDGLAKLNALEKSAHLNYWKLKTHDWSR